MHQRHHHIIFIQFVGPSVAEAAEATAPALPSTAQLSAAESLGGLAVARARQKAMAAIHQTKEEERHGGIWWHLLNLLVWWMMCSYDLYDLYVFSFKKYHKTIRYIFSKPISS